MFEKLLIIQFIVLGCKDRKKRLKSETILSFYGAGYLFYVHAASRGIDDLFVDAALRIESVRIARLFYATVFKSVDDIAVDDL